VLTVILINFVGYGNLFEFEWNQNYPDKNWA